jgi:hypothetical protein
MNRKGIKMKKLIILMATLAASPSSAYDRDYWTVEFPTRNIPHYLKVPGGSVINITGYDEGERYPDCKWVCVKRYPSGECAQVKKLCASTRK